MKRTAASLLILVLIAGTGCAGPPIVANELSQSIRVTSEFSDGDVRRRVIAPGQRQYLAGFRDHPVRVTISTSDGASETFTEAEVPNLLGSRVVGDVVGWRVTDDGILPLEEPDIDM